MLLPGREGHFTVPVNVAVNEPLFAWLCTFGEQAALLGPESARSAMREHIRKISGVYAEAKEERP